MPLDIGVGILLALFTAQAFSIHATLPLILFGIGAALLPDIDIITMLWGKWKHRQLTHYPAVYAPVIIAAYFLFGPVYATLLFGGVYAHLIHDTFGIGWGISWFWPATLRRFLFLPEKGRRARYGSFMTWLPEDQTGIIEEPTPYNWVTTYYFRPSALGAIEYGVLSVSLLTLLFSLIY